MSQAQNLRRGLVALGAVAMIGGLAILVQPPASTLQVSWSYPRAMPATNDGAPVYFEIWESHDLTNWAVLGRVAKPPVPVSAGYSRGFYKARAFDVYAGQTNYSDWSAQ